MGIIKRQGIKTTIINYAGALIGAISVLFIYPLNDEFYGLANWLYSTVYLLIPLASFGITSIVIKYYPIFKNEENRNNGFLSLVFLILSSAYILFLLFWILFKSALFNAFEIIQLNTEAIEKHEYSILILLYLLILLFTLVNHSSNYLRIVIPNIIQQFSYKVFLPVLILLSVHYGFSESEFVFYLLIFFGCAVLLMLIYLKYLGGLKLGRIQKPNTSFSFKSMASYGLFGSLNSLSSSLAFKIDLIMIPFLKDMLNNGFYSKTMFIASIIEMPTRAIKQIAAPIISKAWKENDVDEIGMIYKKASANLFYVGSFAFSAVWLILDDLINISVGPETFPHAREIFFYLGATKLFDMITSVNHQIIFFSKAYRYNLIFLIMLGIMNVIMNYYLIQSHGIVGAAMATAISLFVFNLIRLAFIYIKFHLSPFTVSNLKVMVLLMICIFTHQVINLDLHPLIQIAIKALFVTLVFALVGYYWKISEDINKTIRDIITKIKMRWN